MDIFISWSGIISKRIAEVLQTWLPCIIHEANTFLSTEDIEKGSRWSDTIGEKLEQCNIGIICVTTENIYSPWLNFEAGAISKKLSNAHVCTFLCNLSSHDIPSNSPLMQFQATSPTKEDFYRLIKTINNLKTAVTREDILEKTYERFWGDISRAFEATMSLGFDKHTILTNYPETEREELSDKSEISHNAEMLSLLNINRKMDILLSNANSCTKTNAADCLYYRKKIERYYRILNDYEFGDNDLNPQIDKYVNFVKQIITVKRVDIDEYIEFVMKGTPSRIQLAVDIAVIVYNFKLGRVD